MKSWDEARIEAELRKCMDILCIDRMPTAIELKSIRRNDLHCKVCRTKKYSGWASKLGISLKSCETRTGQFYEKVVASELIEQGYEVAAMSTKHPYDLLVDNAVKIDVKAGRAHFHYGCKAFTFHLSKEEQTCDIYIFVAVGEGDVIENMYVVPSHFVRMKTVNVGLESKYNRFINRWDYIHRYAEFYRKIV